MQWGDEASVVQWLMTKVSSCHPLLLFSVSLCFCAEPQAFGLKLHCYCHSVLTRTASAVQLEPEGMLYSKSFQVQKPVQGLAPSLRPLLLSPSRCYAVATVQLPVPSPPPLTRPYHVAELDTNCRVMCKAPLPPLPPFPSLPSPLLHSSSRP